MCWANGLTQLSLLAYLHCRWADLPALDADTTAVAAKQRTQLTGDSAHQYSVEDPSGQQQAADHEAGEGSKNVVTEVQRLRFIIDNINKSTAVLPKVCIRLVCRGQLCAAAGHSFAIGCGMSATYCIPQQQNPTKHVLTVIQQGRNLPCKEQSDT
jgi:hypothetical protein